MAYSLKISGGGLWRTRAAFFAALLAVPATPLLNPTSVVAQVNIEQMRDSKSAGGFSLECRFNLSSRTGNVDITEVGGDLRTDLITQHSHSFMLLQGSFGWKDGDSFSNAGLLHIRHTRLITAMIAPELFGQIDYDKARLLDQRALAGFGGRFILASREHHRVVLGSGYMIEFEAYDLPAEARHPDEETAHRWTNHLTVALGINQRVSFSSIAYAQPKFDDFSDLRVLLDVTLRVGLARNLTLHNTFRARHDSVPPDGIEELDTKLLVGLALSL